MKPFLTASDYKTIHTLIQNLPAQLKGKEVTQINTKSNPLKSSLTNKLPRILFR